MKGSHRPERVEPTKDGLVRIVLKRVYTDGTIAVEMDPLSLLCRLATSVPLPRYHTVKYAGVLISASKWRARIAPRPVGDVAAAAAATKQTPAPVRRAGTYRPWAELSSAAVKGVIGPRKPAERRPSLSRVGAG